MIRSVGRHLVVMVVPAVVVGAVVAVLIVRSPQPTVEDTSEGGWTCSMHPQVRLSQPGNCPICGMALVPASQLGAEQERMTRQAGIETETVSRHELFKEIRTVGKIDYNERRVALITARVEGRVDRVYADFTGITVKAQDHLVDIYSPLLYLRQAELLRAVQSLQAARGDNEFASQNLESVRLQLGLLGLLPEQIAEIERSGRLTTHLTIYAPIGGVVIEKNVREQQYVKEGDMLYRIAELDPIWLYLDIYEYDLGWIRYGQKVDVTVEAYRGETFSGTVTFINPFLDDQTRTVKVRVNLKNPDYKLKPAMYASARIHVRLRSDGTPQPTGLEGKYICPMHPEIVQDEPGHCSICEMALERVPDVFPALEGKNGSAVASGEDEAQVLAIRKSAVLDTGRRQVAYRKRKDGAYELVELTLGPLADAVDEQGRTLAYYPVLQGLEAGDEVVVQGGFLLDSQRQIEGMPSLLYAEGRSAAALHAGHGGAPPTGAGSSSTSAHQH